MITRFGWFVFKSPQRRMVGWDTLGTDMRGIAALIPNLFAPKINRSETLWICVGNYNRSVMLLNHLIASIDKIKEADNIGISVVDCHSSDVADLKGEIEKLWSGPLVFRSYDMPFSRAAVFNLAINQAPGNLILVCDADVSLPKNIRQQYQRFVTHATAWFPVCQWQLAESSIRWKWLSAGTGIFGATKEQLTETGMYDTKFTSWGKEDWDLFFRFYQNHIMPVRTRCMGLYHHWHAPSEPENFKKMF